MDNNHEVVMFARQVICMDKELRHLREENERLETENAKLQKKLDNFSRSKTVDAEAV